MVHTGPSVPVVQVVWVPVSTIDDATVPELFEHLLLHLSASPPDQQSADVNVDRATRRFHGHTAIPYVTTTTVTVECEPHTPVQPSSSIFSSCLSKFKYSLPQPPLKPQVLLSTPSWSPQQGRCCARRCGSHVITMRRVIQKSVAVRALNRKQELQVSKADFRWTTKVLEYQVCFPLLGAERLPLGHRTQDFTECPVAKVH